MLRGLIVSENLDSVDFMEFRRPPGRPMFLVMYWRYPQDQIEQIVRLPESERQQLIQRIADFKNNDKELPEGKIDLQRVGTGARPPGITSTRGCCRINTAPAAS